MMRARQNNDLGSKEIAMDVSRSRTTCPTFSVSKHTHSVNFYLV